MGVGIVSIPTTSMSKIKHYFEFGNWYFVTTTTYKYIPYFEAKNNAEIVINVLHNLFKKNFLNVDAVVVMPEHVHAILIPKIKLSDYLRDWKRSVARLINEKAGVKNRKIWMEEYFDRQIQNENDLLESRNYLINNPVKKKFVQMSGRI